MTSWTTIADNRLEPGKPARSIDAIALRDNPIAIAENAPNAPKVDQYYALITVSGNWTVPKTGRYQIDLIGGGGGGGAGAGGAGNVGGGGGGSGFVVSVIANLNQGDVYPLIVGGGGGGGVGGGASTGFGYTANGGSGGRFNTSLVAAFGGVSGEAASSSSGARGANAPFAVAGVNAAPGGGGVSGGVGYGAGGGGGTGVGVAGGAGAQGCIVIRGI